MKMTHCWRAVLLLVPVLLFSGCEERGSRPVQTEEEESLGTPGYELEILAVPGANLCLSDKLTDNSYISEGYTYDQKEYFSCAGDTFYRACSIYTSVEKDPFPICEGVYIQMLKPPYDSWVSIPVDEHCFDPEFSWRIEEFRVTENQEMQFLLSGWKTMKDRVYAVGRFYEDGTGEILVKDLKEEELKENWGEGQTEGLQLSESTMRSYAKNSIELVTCHDKEGKLYFGNEYSVWCYDGTDTTEIINFTARDAALSRLRGMAATEDGFVFFGSYVQNDYLIKATYTEHLQPVEKTEIVLANLYGFDELKGAIAGFNMQSEKYRIVMDSPGDPFDKEEKEAYLTGIQREIVKGEGPDILDPYVVSDREAYAANGCLLPIDDYFRGREEQFVAGALQGGIINGTGYGLPYCMCLMDFLVTGADAQGEKISRDAREWMEYVKNSGAKYMFYKIGVTDYYQETLYLFLKDQSDTTYIDWGNGISHLNEQPFIDLLEFTKEYSLPDGSLSPADAVVKLREGEIAAYCDSFRDNTDIIFLNVLYDNQPCYVGAPSVNGKGVDIMPMYLYVNANTKQKEGVYAFFDYLLSDMGQRNCFTVPYPQQLPIRKETIMWMLDSNGDGTSYYQAQKTFMGLTFTMKRLSEEQKEQAVYLLEHSRPLNLEWLKIRAMVKEETAPYFQGQKSAREVAELLHSRLQLLLYEKQ